MPTPDIFKFPQLRDYLEAIRAPGEGRKPRSLPQLAKILGYTSPRAVAMLLTGKRLPTFPVLQRLSASLRLGPNERRYLELIVERERLGRTGADPAEIDQELRRLTPDSGPACVALTAEQFEVMSAWYFLPLRHLVQRGDALDDLNAVCLQLRKKVTSAQARAAFSVMELLGLIGRTSDGTLESRADAVSAGNQLPSARIRAFHVQMMERAREALVEQEMANRAFGNVTITIRAERVAEAMRAMQDFQTVFANTFHADEGDAIYQLSCQFFAHTAGLRRQTKKGQTPCAES